jgi:glycosyltransferase involved in cell wall biosynthesis
MDPLVSIVTPVYNDERYLRDCVESVLAQTYQNWDYTVVDNCSTDQTLAVASEYAARDPRIRVHINKTYVPVIENYNIAFHQISPQSKYCKPLAADDMLFPECLERMVEFAEKHETVAVVGAYGLFSGAETTVFFFDTPYPTSVFKGRELAREALLGKREPFGAASWFLFRSEVVRVRDTFFNEANINADAEACLELMEHHDFGFVHQVLTFVRSRENSLTANSENLNTWLPSELRMLLTYGPKYLSDEELADRIHHRLREYYDYLAGHLSWGRGHDFWRYHRTALADMGYPLSLPRLLAHRGLYVLDLVLNPKLTAKRVTRYVRRKSRKPKTIMSGYRNEPMLRHPGSR